MSATGPATTTTADPSIAPSTPSSPGAAKKKSKKKARGGGAGGGGGGGGKSREPPPPPPSPLASQPQQLPRPRQRSRDEEGVEQPGTPKKQDADPESATDIPTPDSPHGSPHGSPVGVVVNGHRDDDSPTNGHAVAAVASTTGDTRTTPAPTPAPADSVEKLAVVTRDREALMTQVQELRRQLETLSKAHGDEVSRLQDEVDESNAARETAEDQYQNLVERVEKIKETLSDRLRRDRRELEETKERADELELENEQLRTNQLTAAAETVRLREALANSGRELGTVRSRSSLSAQNWLREKEDLSRACQQLRQELETTSNAMAEWEVIAMEERSVKDSLAEKVSELQEELAAARDTAAAAGRERDVLSSAVDGLQHSLAEIQDARRRELREMVESAREENRALEERARRSDAAAAEAEAARASLAAEVDRTAPFEREVREKNLLIGKLRHEAIVLNDHLTKALRYLKKTKPEDNVDRQIVTNHLLHFLNLDRADPKRFQILQVMAGYLGWTDEQREQSGLARPGASSSSSSSAAPTSGIGAGLRLLPASPFHRTPSTPSLNADFLSETTTLSSSSSTVGATSGTGRSESLADLWAGFLERSALEEAGGAPDGAGGGRRKDSTSSRPDTRGGGA